MLKTSSIYLLVKGVQYFTAHRLISYISLSPKLLQSHGNPIFFQYHIQTNAGHSNEENVSCSMSFFYILKGDTRSVKDITKRHTELVYHNQYHSLTTFGTSAIVWQNMGWNTVEELRA